MSDLHAKLYQTKMTLLGVVFTVVGLATMGLARWLEIVDRTAEWLVVLPLSETGASLFTIGVLGIAYDYYTRKDEEANARRRLRETFREEAPVITDTIIEAFAIHPSDLKRVATPELLDDLATNAMALRLGDDQFAREIYADVRVTRRSAPLSAGTTSTSASGSLLQ